MAKNFWIDWSDPAFPEIRPVTSYTPAEEELLTLREAKREIIQRARQDRQHWLAIINRTKELTVASIIREEADRG